MSATRGTSLQKNRWRSLIWVLPSVAVVVVVVVLGAQWLRTLPWGDEFVSTYSGENPLPAAAPVGIPVWLAWQHFLNAFLLVLIIRSGWLVRTTQRPSAFWTPRYRGIARSSGAPRKISLEVWLHQSVDVLWLINGIVFIALLSFSGQWVRIVPTSVDIVPNALSAALQYASLDWPLDNGWVNYNALQVLAYFTTVFIAAPLAIVSGVRLSSVWPSSWARLSRAYPIELARRIHFPVMIYFVLFIVVHVTLVLATGAIKNLNHMYAARDDDGLLGLWFFLGAALLTALAWVAVRPSLLRPIAALTGTLSRQ